MRQRARFEILKSSRATETRSLELFLGCGSASLLPLPARGALKGMLWEQ